MSDYEVICATSTSDLNKIISKLNMKGSGTVYNVSKPSISDWRGFQICVTVRHIQEKGARVEIKA